MRWKDIYKRLEFWIGIIILVFGLYQIFAAWNWLALLSPEKSWPLLLIFAGVFQLASQRYRDVGASLLLLAVGAGLTLSNFGYFTMQSIETEWPSGLRHVVKSLIDFFQAVLSTFSTLKGV